MIQDESPPGIAGWAAINDITSQLVDVMDTLVEPDTDHVMARRALARTIASMRADKSIENEDIINKQVACQLNCFRIINAGIYV
jgi:hypothetical protein